MHIELLVVPECPHEGPARTVIQAALSGLDVRAEVTTTTITSIEQAEALGFTGSPTVLVDGRDPFAEPGAVAGLACRVYWTPTGPTGLPPLHDLQAHLRRTVPTRSPFSSPSGGHP